MGWQIYALSSLSDRRRSDDSHYEGRTHVLLGTYHLPEVVGKALFACLGNVRVEILVGIFPGNLLDLRFQKNHCLGLLCLVSVLRCLLLVHCNIRQHNALFFLFQKSFIPPKFNPTKDFNKTHTRNKFL